MAANGRHFGQILMRSPDKSIPAINFKLGIYTYYSIPHVLSFLFFQYLEIHLINIQKYANLGFFTPH